MDLHFTSEQTARLEQMARQQGKNRETLLVDAASRLFEEDRHYRELIQERIAQANRGDFIEEEEMDRRVRRMLER